MYDSMEDLLPSNKNKERARKSALLNEIKDIEDVSPMNGTFLPSSLLQKLLFLLQNFQRKQ
jgi:hypothetical protein